MSSVAIESPEQPEVLELLRLGDEFALSLYAPDSYYGLALESLLEPAVRFFVARVDGIALGTSALVDQGDGVGELKRMFVHERGRGQGIASDLLRAVEAEAAASGISLLRLETGPKQPAAIALYEKHGYTWIPQFGKYVGDPDSYCMAKAIGA